MKIFSGKSDNIQSDRHLCRSCQWSQFMAGHRDSDRMAVCTNTSPNMIVPFAMLECSSFSDRHRPGYEQARISDDQGTRRRSGTDPGYSGRQQRRGLKSGDENTDQNGPSLHVLFN
jgi:ribosomal protein S27AE